jgi:hypothetical protein
MRRWESAEREMKTKIPAPIRIVERLRFVERLRADGWTIADAVRSVGMTEIDYSRWRIEFGGLLRTLGPALDSRLRSRKRPGAGLPKV